MHSIKSSSQQCDAGQTATESRNIKADPVWLRIPEATRLFGIGRSSIYELIAAGKIRSRVLKRRRDAMRGIRLVSYDALCTLIESEAD